MQTSATKLCKLAYFVDQVWILIARKHVMHIKIKCNEVFLKHVALRFTFLIVNKSCQLKHFSLRCFSEHLTLHNGRVLVSFDMDYFSNSIST
jgi:hypothetical protein